jgi:hypothetical protein
VTSFASVYVPEWKTRAAAIIHFCTELSSASEIKLSECASYTNQSRIRECRHLDATLRLSSSDEWRLQSAPPKSQFIDPDRQQEITKDPTARLLSERIATW